MKKFLTIFIVMFLFVVVAPALASDYNYDTKVDPKQFSKWVVENDFVGNTGELYIWVKSPDEKAKLNRAILKTLGGFIIEFICWNKNDTSFSIIRRFKYNIRKDRYEEMDNGGYRDLIK
jgi:hypothetical protein